ncbi:hypothetical protein O9929_18240 [Vibrio lentus]|nr:hypothetical protein [Vibrio lentus]
MIESNSTFHLIQAVTSGLCCAVMPLNSGLERLNEQLRIVPIEKAIKVHSPLGLLKRKQRTLFGALISAFNRKQNTCLIN